MAQKLCPRCQEEKPLDEFPVRKRSNGSSRRHSYCPPCRREISSEWRKNNLEKDRLAHHKNHIKTRYGLDYADFERMVKEQNNCCAICGYQEARPEYNLHVDHCHKSGKVRALLCGPCNKGLGCFRDNPQTVRAAANYLEEHQ